MLGTLGAIAKSRSSGAADGAASNPDHGKGEIPAPRADQTMNPDQVKQATDALISDRTRLSTDAQASQQII